MVKTKNYQVRKRDFNQHRTYRHQKAKKGIELYANKFNKGNKFLEKYKF